MEGVPKEKKRISFLFFSSFVRQPSPPSRRSSAGHRTVRQDRRRRSLWFGRSFSGVFRRSRRRSSGRNFLLRFSLLRSSIDLPPIRQPFCLWVWCCRRPVVCSPRRSLGCWVSFFFGGFTKLWVDLWFVLKVGRVDSDCFWSR